MTEFKFAILGGGMVAGYAVRQLVESGLKPGELVILSADTSVPYERPPLSKGFLAGKENEDAVRINPADFYREHGIELKLGCEVSAVNAERRRLKLKSGGEIGFGNLIIATGASPRVLDIPGAKLRNVYYLRSLADSKAIRDSAAGVKRAAVIGGGFIAMEVAAVLAQKGVEIAMFLREDRVWKKLFSPEMSAFFENYYAARGVRTIKNATVAELRGEGAVNAVVLSNGQPVACDMVVAGIGVQPVTNVLAGSGIEVADGIIVNEYLETSRAGIYAAGDAANYQDVLFGKRRRVEHWDNAVSQGQHCARILTGKRIPFRHVPYFFSDIFDLSYEYWGDSSSADRVVHRGDVSTPSFSVWWLSKNRLIAAFAMNRPDEERDRAPKWIESLQPISGAKLEDASRPIDEAAA